MGRTPMRWLFLLALSLAILGAIQCPATDTPSLPPTRSRSPLRNIGRAISNRLSRMRSRGSSRSGSGSESDGGSNRDAFTASGRYSGGERLPRSRSPSPSPGGGAGGGGGDGASSSGGGSTMNKMYAAFPSEKVPRICMAINERGTSQIVSNMRLSVFSAIIREMRETVRTDECGLMAGAGRRHQPGSQKCQEMYGEFKKIEPQYRGECADAVTAQCLQWPATAGAPEEKKCTFFIQTGCRSATRYDGFYASLADCINGIKHQLFMDNQLADVGIHPPSSPPKPLLPPYYSP